jgi:hypothetical protein
MIESISVETKPSEWSMPWGDDHEPVSPIDVRRLRACSPTTSDKLMILVVYVM